MARKTKKNHRIKSSKAKRRTPAKRVVDSRSLLPIAEFTDRVLRVVR